ncbi:MAG: hypothetical protein EBX90_05495 [Betaproteobacteria bacterium]|nr:hypothetical protein [Betaproteobacteria bacterium]
MVSAPDLDHNLKRAEALIHEAAAGGAQLISLPEYFCLLGRRDTDKVAIRESWGKGPMQQFLSEMAQRHQIWLAGGTIPLQCQDPRRVRNTLLMIDPQGQVARAIENQCYVLAAAQGGEHPNGRRTWGQSMVVDPWGEVIAQRAEGEAVVFAKLQRERIVQVRGMLPALAHRIL